jgi:alcohol dehydrogenase (NADP+)
VLLSWALHRGTATIPKSVEPGRLRQNLAAAEVALTSRDMEEIAGLDRHRRYIRGDFWTIEGSPYTLENLWDE